MELTDSQKQTGFETWQHIWNVQRFIISCHRGFVLGISSPKMDLVSYLSSCVRHFNAFQPIPEQTSSRLEATFHEDHNDLELLQSLTRNTFQLLLDIYNNPLACNRLQEHISVILTQRCLTHDQSKFSATEVQLFDEYTPKLKTAEFGSDEYKGFLVGLKPALDSHYAHNRHHPEHYPDGIHGMNLIDVIEMCCDWAASGLRTSSGSFEKSIEVTKQRFGYGTGLEYLLLNTYSVFIEPILRLTNEDYLIQERM